MAQEVRYRREKESLTGSCFVMATGHKNSERKKKRDRCLRLKVSPSRGKEGSCKRTAQRDTCKEAGVVSDCCITPGAAPCCHVLYWEVLWFNKLKKLW